MSVSLYSERVPMQYIAPKLLYTFLFACQGSAPVYLALFYSSHLGLKGDQIGLLVAIAPFISAIACPLWTSVADKTRTHGYIMCMIQTLATLAVVSVMGIAVLAQSIAEDDLDRQGKLKVILVTSTSICFAFFGVPVGPLVDGGVLKILGRRNKDQYGRQRMFGSISFGLASSLVGFIADWTEDLNSIFYVYAVSACFFIMTAGSTHFRPEIPQAHGSLTTSGGSMTLRTRRGVNRQTGSPSSAMPMETHDRDTDKRLRRQVERFNVDEMDLDENEEEEEPLQTRRNEIQRLIQFATESSIIEAVNLSNPPAHRSSTGADDWQQMAAPTSLVEFIKQPNVLLFFLTMMLMGASLSMVTSFLFIFLKKDLGASSSLVGLTGLVGSVTELLFFFYSRDLIRTFGIKSLIVLGHVLTIIRVFSYTLLPRNPSGAHIALALHLLNGIAFSALWGAGVVQADELAPPSLQATSQGILAAMYAGIGTGLGSLLGGLIYEKMGASSLFYAVIGLTSFSLELYLETNTYWGLRHIAQRIYSGILAIHRQIQHMRGLNQAVPRWSGARRTGPIHLNEGEE